MLTYNNYEIDLRSIPGEICLTFYICDCPCHCQGCSSPWLWQKGKYEFSYRTIQRALAKFPYITCVLFMGGDNDPQSVYQFADYIREHGKAAGFYSGGRFTGEAIDHLDYYKVGPWSPSFGPLNCRTTNQRLYQITHICSGNRMEHHVVNITSKFWTKENEWRPQQEEKIEKARTEWLKSQADDH